VNAKIAAKRVGDFEVELMEDFFQGFAQSRESQRPFALSLWSLVASSSRSHIQGIRPRASVRRLSRQAPSSGLAQHQGLL